MKKNRTIKALRTRGNQENQEAKDLEMLIEILTKLKTTEDMHNFLKDLCTPQELKAMSERWKVCKLLEKGELSYREISEQTGVSLATIVRVARFLNNEPHHGYELALQKIKQ